MTSTLLSTAAVIGVSLVVALPIAALTAPTEAGAAAPMAIISDVQGLVTLQHAVWPTEPQGVIIHGIVVERPPDLLPPWDKGMSWRFP